MGQPVACCICHEPVDKSVLCRICADRIRGTLELVPAQIRSQGGAEHCEPQDACLIDSWGRIHPLWEHTAIGRDAVEFCIQIQQGTVSRHHAVLDCQGTRVFVRDVGSTNGTIVSGVGATQPIELSVRDTVFFGSVGFYFLRPIPTQRLEQLEVSTVRSPTFLQAQQDKTDIHGLEKLKIECVEATGGGGGFAVIADARIKLSTSQFQLLSLLKERMRTDIGSPHIVRGYVNSSEILGHIDWDTPYPNEEHVKQLVRRLRRTLKQTGRNDLIQSEQGLGYRLSVIS